MQAGDLILMDSRNARGRINRAAQKTVTLKKARFPHVLICVAPSVVIDATPAHGVALRNVAREVISERLTDQMCADGAMRVLRPPSGSWDRQAGDALVSTMAHMGKKYNWRFLMPQASDADPESQEAKSVFCSELAALLLKQWKVLPPEWRRPSSALPVHLQQLGWEDVTDEWRADLQTIREWAESELLKDCKNFGLALYPGNQQIHLLQSIKHVEVNQKNFTPVSEKDFEKAMQALWRRHGLNRPKK